MAVLRDPGQASGPPPERGAGTPRPSTPMTDRDAGTARPERTRRRWRLRAFLGVLGPGVIAAAAGNDAGGIATYSTVGADFGYSLLWAMVLVTVSLAIVQEMCARMGAATGKGLADLIREHLGIHWTAFIMLALLIANGAVTLSEFLGVAAAFELFGVPRWLGVPPVAFVVWWLVTKGSYKRVEKVFLALALVFLAYPIAALLADPNWGEVAAASVTPTVRLDVAWLGIFITLVGTTISPYMQIYVQSSVAERGVTMVDYPATRLEVIAGVTFSCLIGYFIIVACGTQLFPRGISVDSAAEAALALEPLMGTAAKYLFGAGLFGACVLAGAVLPLSTAYSICEAFGFERGVSRTFREAPVFHTIFSGMIAASAVVAMVPGLPIIEVLLNIYLLNGLILPILLVAIVQLVNNPAIMRQHTNGPLYNAVAWITVAVVVVMSLAMLALTVLGWVGLVG